MDCSTPEEPLGSVTQILDVRSPSSGVPLRSSARVSKKKQDSLRSAITSPTSEKHDLKKDDTPEETQEKPVVKKAFWPVAAKDLFFEAVNEYGKDFAAIERYFEMKSKKTGDIDIKTQKQIRYFYYRMWSKIAPKLVFPPHIRKQAQELYGLINYGVLRKKMKIRTKKEALKLNELVIKGFTQLRGKNKNIFVRTPRCRALRRLCQIQDNREAVTRVPASVRVELVPADNETWSRVQSMAQNPRMHIHVPLQYRLSNLILFMQKRWLPRHEKYKLKRMEGLEGDVGTIDTGEQLVLVPSPTEEVHVAQVSISQQNTQTKVCLSAYEEKLGKKGASLEILNKLYMEFGTKAKKMKVDSSNIEKKSDDCKRSDTECKDDESPVSSKAEVKPDFESTIHLKEELVSEESSTLLSPPPCDTHHTDEGRRDVPETSVEEHDPANDELVGKIREGYTSSNANALTVGDIYLLVGNDYKLQMDYFWRPIPDSTTTAASVLKLSALLSRLVRMAKLTRSHAPVQCPCGHQCSDTKRPRKDSFGEDGMYNGIVTSDSTFRRPILQPTSKKVNHGAGRLDAESFRAQMDKLTPRFCNRRGRGITPKTVVVQRTLPLVPKTNNAPSVVAIKLLQDSIPATDALPSSTSASPGSVVKEPRRITPTTIGPAQIQRTSLEPPPSPTPSISALLDETLRDFPPPANFTDAGDDVEPPPSPSPSVILREGWLSEEVTDYSLSSILSHLETPLKSSQSQISFDVNALPDVDTQFLTETSIDYMAKFADLAAKVTSESSQ